MTKISRNIKNTVWVIFANGISSLFQFLLISVMTKRFGINSVGVYSSATALILPIITFVMGLNLNAIQLTDVENKYLLPDFFSVRIIGALFTSIIVVFLLIIRGFNYLTMTVTISLLLRSISELFSEISTNEMIKTGSYSKYASSIIIRSIISFAMFVFISLLTNNFVLSIFSYSITWIILFFIIDFKNANVKSSFNNYRLKKSTILNLVVVSLPLAFVSSINVLYNSIPKYFIEYYISVEALGIFSATSYFSLIGGLFVTGITLTFSNYLAQIDKNGETKKFIKVILIQELLVILACIALFCVFYFAGDIILPILYSKEFVKYIDVILFLIVAMSFNFTSRVLGTACTSARKNKEQLATACICILVLTISSWVLIPKYKLIGASISMLLAYVVKNILLIRVLRNKFIYKNIELTKEIKDTL